MPKKKYRISNKSLRTMGLSDEAMEEMIQKGIAEPSPIDRKRSAIPKRLSKQHHADAMEILSAIDDLNEDLMEAGTPVRLVLQFRSVKRVEPSHENVEGTTEEPAEKPADHIARVGTNLAEHGGSGRISSGIYGGEEQW